MTRFVLTLPWPPSVNGYWRAFRGRQILSKRGREYRHAVRVACIESSAHGAGLEERLHVTLTLHPPDKRRRDVDNYGKAILDGLTHAGVWLDDEQVDRLWLERGPVEPGGRVTVRVAEVLP